MPAITATDLSYTVLPTVGATTGQSPGMQSRIHNRDRVTRVRVTLASNAATYPTAGGITLSTSPGDWGMVRNVEYIVLYGWNQPTNGVRVDEWRYSATAHALRGYQQNTASGTTGATGFSELPTTWTSAANGPVVFYCEAHGW